MKLSDLITLSTGKVVDKLNETWLFEMATSRKAAKITVTSLSPTLFKHLLKLFIFNSPENKPHWIMEVNSYLRIINEIYLKPNNRKLRDKELYNWLIFDSSPYYSRGYILSIVEMWKDEDYPNIEMYDFDPDHVLNEILNIINRVCVDISKNKFVSIKYYLP